MRFSLTPFVLLPFTALMGCGELLETVDPPGPGVGCAIESWDFEEDFVLTKACSPYEIDDSINVTDGATLTIEPGVELRFDAGEWLQVGNQTEGGLIARGTAAEPIIFTAINATASDKGTWHGLFFRDNTLPGSVVENAVVRLAGRSGFGVEGCVTVDEVSADVLTLSNVRFEDCLGSGLSVDGGRVALSGLDFADSDAGLRLHTNNVADATAAYTYENTPHNLIDGADLDADATWVAQPVPYRVSDSIDVRGTAGPTLTLEAGLTLQFEEGEWLEVGENEPGVLVVAGTATAPVVFEGDSSVADAGHWYGLRFRANVGPGTRLDFAVVRHGGRSGFSTSGCVTVRDAPAGRLSITNSVFEQCEQSGVGAVSAGFAFEAFDGNSFGDSDFGMYLNAGAVGSVASPQTYANVSFNRIEGDTIVEDATWVAQPIPWQVDDSIDVESPATPTLTLSAGVTLQFEEGEWLEIGDNDGGSLVTLGTAVEPVIFESQPGAGVAGTWHGLRLHTNTVGANLAGLTVRDAGRSAFSTGGCVTIFGGATGRITITGSTFERCSMSGVAARDAGFAFAAFNENTFTDSESGMWLHPSALASVGAQQYNGVDRNRIAEGIASETGTWVAQSVPWYVEGSIGIEGASNPVITIAAGGEYRFDDNEWLEVGDNAGGSLIAAGTAAEKVVFTTSNAVGAAGNWRGIRLRNQTLAGTVLDNVELRFAGRTGFSTRGGVTLFDVADRVTIRNSTFDENTGADIWIDCGSNPTLENNTYDLGPINENGC